MGYIKENIVADLIKTFLLGAAVTLASLLFFLFFIWGMVASVINYPKTFMLIGFIIFSFGVGYDIRRPKSWRPKL